MSADPIREALQARLGAQYAIEALLGQGGVGSVHTPGLGDPGFAAYTRSYAAWEEFLRRTEAGDDLIAPQRREARTALQRLKDGGRR